MDNCKLKDIRRRIVLCFVIHFCVVIYSLISGSGNKSLYGFTYVSLCKTERVDQWKVFLLKGSLRGFQIKFIVITIVYNYEVLVLKHRLLSSSSRFRFRPSIKTYVSFTLIFIILKKKGHPYYYSIVNNS